jgi:hypothetical protein
MYYFLYYVDECLVECAKGAPRAVSRVVQGRNRYREDTGQGRSLHAKVVFVIDCQPIVYRKLSAQSENDTCPVMPSLLRDIGCSAVIRRDADSTGEWKPGLPTTHNSSSLIFIPVDGEGLLIVSIRLHPYVFHYGHMLWRGGLLLPHHRVSHGQKAVAFCSHSPSPRRRAGDEPGVRSRRASQNANGRSVAVGPQLIYQIHRSEGSQRRLARGLL